MEGGEGASLLLADEVWEIEPTEEPLRFRTWGGLPSAFGWSFLSRLRLLPLNIVDFDIAARTIAIIDLETLIYLQTDSSAARDFS
jgi:hypothetical protein